MTAPAIPADAVWGVQWEVPILPDNDPSVPVQPQQPDVPYDDDEHLDEWNTYNAAIGQWYQDILDLANMHPEWWQTTVSTVPTEPSARKLFADLSEAHSNSPFTRNTALVWSAPTDWTPVE